MKKQNYPDSGNIPSLDYWKSLGCRFWTYVTRPEYYMEDPEDPDSPDKFGPVITNESEIREDYNFWRWSGNKHMKLGDLIFLYRTAPKKDIKYVFQALSDAYNWPDEDYDPEDAPWEWACDIVLIEIFEHPLSLKEMRADPILSEWSAVRCSMQSSTFRMTPEQWHRVFELVHEKGDITGIEVIEPAAIDYAIPKKFKEEKEIEEIIVQNLPKLFKKEGFRLKLYRHSDGKSGRQFGCKNIGKIDILAEDKKTGALVVIEIKKDIAGRSVAGQIDSYIGFVTKYIADGRQVFGFVVSRGADKKLESATEFKDYIRVYDYSSLFERIKLK